jgi:hypothetical protein
VFAYSPFETKSFTTTEKANSFSVFTSDIGVAGFGFRAEEAHQGGIVALSSLLSNKTETT